jgi:hypothetical protein
MKRELTVEKMICKITDTINESDSDNTAKAFGLTAEEMICEITKTLNELDGDDIAEAYNMICNQHAEYVGDDLFEVKSHE